MLEVRNISRWNFGRKKFKLEKISEKWQDMSSFLKFRYKKKEKNWDIDRLKDGKIVLNYKISPTKLYMVAESKETATV